MGVFLATATFNLFKHKAEFLNSQKAFPAAEGSFLHTNPKSRHKTQKPEDTLEEPSSHCEAASGCPKAVTVTFPRTDGSPLWSRAMYMGNETRKTLLFKKY